MITAGNLVTASDSASVLTTLVSLDKVYVYFDVDEATFLRYQQQGRHDARLPVKVGLVGEDGTPHQGLVDFTDNQLNAGTGTIRMRALLDNRERRFTPGLFARVQMPGSAEFNAMLIDDKAVMTDQNRNSFTSSIKTARRSAATSTWAAWPKDCASCRKGWQTAIG